MPLILYFSEMETKKSRLVDINICPRSSDPFYIVYYIKWITTSWTHSMYKIHVSDKNR